MSPLRSAWLRLSYNGKLALAYGKRCVGLLVASAQAKVISPSSVKPKVYYHVTMNVVDGRWAEAPRLL